MNTPKSSEISSSTTFKNLQQELINWAAHWITTGDTMEQLPIDIPDLVHLFQALGFYIRRIDGNNPHGICPLRDHERGIRIIVQCGHSGQKFYLEQPLKADLCKCRKVSTDDSSEDAFWEIVAPTTSLNQSASPIEIGSDLIPPISKELKQIIYSVANYLIHLMYGTNVPKSDSVTSSVHSRYGNTTKRYSDQCSFTQRPEHTLEKVNASMYDFTKTPLIVTTPNRTTSSPARYRSLDTLTSAGVAEIPEPGPLINSISESEISTELCPKINFTADDADGDSKFIVVEESLFSVEALALLKSAHRDLSNAISLIEGNIANVSSESVFEKQLKSSSTKTPAKE